MRLCYKLACTLPTPWLWHALLSALEGNATDCAASILLWISSRRGLSSFLIPDMPCRNSQCLAGRFGINRKRLVDAHSWFSLERCVPRRLRSLTPVVVDLPSRHSVSPRAVPRGDALAPFVSLRTTLP